MTSATVATTWNAYLPIATPRGATDAALVVLRVVRRRVLPLVRRLEAYDRCRRWHGTESNPLSRLSYSLLIHNRESGVPCRAKDNRPYAHLRLQFGPSARRGGRLLSARDVRRLLPTAWVLIRQVHPTPEEDRVHRHLDAQTAWYLGLVEEYAELGDAELLQKIRAHLHFFSNMSQLVVS